jgi:DNA-binding beta-propeller fold protein YncE
VVVVALGLASWRWRWGIWWWFPFLVPGVLLGVVLILVLNRPPLLSLYRGAGIVVVAFAIRYGVIGWSGVRQAMRSTERAVVEAGQIDGARGMGLLGEVYWPQVAPRLGATWMLVYLLCLWDVETLLLIAPPGCESLAGRIFGLLHYGHNAQVSALCLVLLGLAVAPLLTWLIAVGGRVLWHRDRSGGQRAVTVILLASLLSTGCAPPGEPGGTRGSSLFERVEVIGGRGTGLGQFHKPRSVAVDRDDNLYVVDMTGRVQKFSPAGQYLAYWQFPESDRGQPKGMGLDEVGNVVVVEPHYARVNHFTPTGRLVEQWGVSGTAPGQLSFPRAVAVRADGDIWVSEYGVVERVQRFRAKDRALLKVLGGSIAGEPGFNRAEGLALDEAQRLYVADSCNHRIQVFDPEGQLLRAYGRAGDALGELSYPYDVRVDAAGRQYVCEFGNSRIQVFDAFDRPLEVLGGAGSAPGRLNNPWSIALDSRGNLYVADTLNHRVQKWVARRGGLVGP